MKTGRFPPTSDADSEDGPQAILGQAEDAKESPPSGSVVASAGDLLTAMCRGSLASLVDSILTDESRPSGFVAASAGDLLTTMYRGSLGSLADLENRPPAVLGGA